MKGSVKVCILCQNEFQEDKVTQYKAFQVKAVFQGNAEFDVNDSEDVYLCDSCQEVYNKTLDEYVVL